MSLVFKVVRNGLHRYTHCIHVGTCDVTRVQSGTEWIASVYTAYMSERVVFKVLRNGLHRCTHCIQVETCDVTRVQSGTECTASVYTLSERVMSRVFQVLRNGLHRYTHCIWYGMDCIGIHTAYMSKRVMSLVFKVVRNGLHRYTHCIHVGTCDVTRVQSGTEWIASVYTAYMSERVHETTSPLRKATTVELRHSPVVVVAHETSSTWRRATYGMQKTKAVRYPCLLAATHETSSALHGETGVTLQHPLRLPGKMTVQVHQILHPEARLLHAMSFPKRRRSEAVPRIFRP